MLEILLSLLLSVQQKVPEIGEEVALVLMRFLSSPNSKTKKITIDIFYTLCAIDQ